MILARLCRVTDGKVWFEIVADDDALLALANSVAENHGEGIVVTGHELSADPQAPLPWLGRCETCKHWGQSADGNDKLYGYGQCGKADNDERHDLFWVGGHDFATLFTDKSFGCVAFEVKERSDG